MEAISGSTVFAGLTFNNTSKINTARKKHVYIETLYQILQKAQKIDQKITKKCTKIVINPSNNPNPSWTVELEPWLWTRSPCNSN